MRAIANSKQLMVTLVVALCSHIGIFARADDLTPDRIAWRQVGNSITILGYYGTNRTLNIPSTITNLPVTSIVHEAFAHNLTFETVIIPDSVTSIDYLAFNACYNLSNCTIGAGLTSVGDSIFFNCYGLKRVTLTEGTANVGAYMFANCTALSTISLPDTVTNIGSYAFGGCSSLVAVRLGENLKVIGDHSFAGCKLTEVTIPQNVANIGLLAFANFTLNNVCFQGNAPIDGGTVFYGNPIPTLYVLAGTTGWGPQFSGYSTTPCAQCLGVATSPPATSAVIHPPTLPATGAHNLALVIHGWTPFWAPTPYSSDAAMPNLTKAIQNRLRQDGVANNWLVELFNWSQIPGPFNSHGTAQNSVRNAVNIGTLYGKAIAAAGYDSVLLISHSAGAWMANQIAKELEDANVFVSLTFLDAFVPSEFLIQASDTDENYTPDLLGKGVSMVEQYFHASLFGTGLANILTNAVDYDITALQECAGDKGDEHGWPIRWYTATVQSKNYIWGDDLGYQNAFVIAGKTGVKNLLSCAGHSAVIEPRGIPTSVTNSIHKPGNLPNGSMFGAEVAFHDLTIIAHGENGQVISGANGVTCLTSNLTWASFSLDVTNDITLGTVDYSISAPSDAVLGLFMDGQAMAFIQNTPTNELSSFEMFPLPTVLNLGHHNLTVSLESLKGTSISATLKTCGFYYAVSQPLITGFTADGNGNVVMTWECGAGLKYQPQYNTDLLSAGWINLGGLRSSGSNAVMTVIDPISKGSERYYRVVVVQ